MFGDLGFSGLTEPRTLQFQAQDCGVRGVICLKVGLEAWQFVFSCWHKQHGRQEQAMNVAHGACSVLCLVRVCVSHGQASRLRRILDRTLPESLLFEGMPRDAATEADVLAARRSSNH